MSTRPRKRRTYGSGAVFQRKDGMWIGRIQAGHDSQGRARRITVSAKTEALCKERLEDKKREIARTGIPEHLSGKRVTVEAWSQVWLQAAVDEMRPKSYATTKSAVKVWIVPTIGHKRLDSLTPTDIRSVAKAIHAKGRKASTSVRTFATMMDVPERIFHIRRPDLNVSDREAMSLDDALAILKVVADRADAAKWVAVLLQGIRQGERLGLTWSAIDFERDLIHVDWQLQPLPYLDPKDKSKGFRVPPGYTARHLTQAFHLVAPKSKSSRRVIPMVPWMKDALLAWREIAPRNDYDLVWTTDAGLPWREPADRAEWVAIQELADVWHPVGRRYVLHEGRNTTATLLLELGVPKDIVEAILGHSKFVESYDSSDRTGRARTALESLATRLSLGVGVDEGASLPA
jgi:integrase